MKHLVLLGGGLAHVEVLHAFAAEPPAGARITLVTPHPRRLYPPMLAGFVAGRYTLDDCALDLAALARRAGAELRASTAVSVDANARTLTLANGDTAPYDVLSVDNADSIDRDAIPGARGLALFVQPTQTFARLVTDLVELAQGNSLNVVVIGGEPRAIELAMALQLRLGQRARVCLVTGGDAPLAAHGAKVQARVAAALRRRGVTVIEDRCTAVDAAHVQLASGARHACDAPVVVARGGEPAWIARSGLALDAQGAIAAGATRQSTSHAEVFAAGEAPGALLALNLRRFVAGGTLAAQPAPRPAPLLLDCGEGRAIAVHGDRSAEGRWVAWWKERRDRRAASRLQAAAAGLPVRATSAGGS